MSTSLKKIEDEILKQLSSIQKKLNDPSTTSDQRCAAEQAKEKLLHAPRTRALLLCRRPITDSSVERRNANLNQRDVLIDLALYMLHLLNGPEGSPRVQILLDKTPELRKQVEHIARVIEENEQALADRYNDAQVIHSTASGNLADVEKAYNDEKVPDLVEQILSLCTAVRSNCQTDRNSAKDSPKFSDRDTPTAT